MVELKIYLTFALHFTEIVAQSVRAPDCGSGGRGFETRLSPLKKPSLKGGFFVLNQIRIDNEDRLIISLIC